MMKENEIHWLTRRLTELGKSKRQLALLLGVNPTRMNDLVNGIWKFQASHIKKAAEFLEFDRMAFLDFVSGEISEEELWQAKPEPKITKEDLALLNAIKSVAARPQAEEETQDPTQSPTIPTKERER